MRYATFDNLSDVVQFLSDARARGFQGYWLKLNASTFQARYW